jgi:hypothetical protein
VKEAPSFGESQEFLDLDPEDRDVPSVVCGAFRGYVERLHSKGYSPTRRSSVADEAQRAETIRAMERLATSPDLEVQNALVVDVFEHLDLSEGDLDAFLSRLGPSARALYGRWIA